MEKEGGRYLCLTVDELMNELKIGRNRAYELVHTDGFPAVKIGRSVRISRSGLEKWIAEQTETGREY